MNGAELNGRVLRVNYAQPYAITKYKAGTYLDKYHLYSLFLALPLRPFSSLSSWCCSDKVNDRKAKFLIISCSKLKDNSDHIF